MSDCAVPHCGSTAAVRGHGVCDECWDRRGRALVVIPALWNELHHHLPPSRSGLSEFVSQSSSGGSRLPVNAAVLNAMQEIPRTLHLWAQACRRMRGYCELETEGKRWGYLLSDAVVDLESYDEELHYSEYGVDYLIDVFAAHSRMFSLAGLAHLVHRLNVACPACGRRELIRHNGQGRVRCTRCGESWSLPEYRRLAATEVRGSVTTST